jgi:hypothetical protein
MFMAWPQEKLQAIRLIDGALSRQQGVLWQKAQLMRAKATTSSATEQGLLKTLKNE